MSEWAKLCATAVVTAPLLTVLIRGDDWGYAAAMAVWGLLPIAWIWADRAGKGDETT